MASISEIRAKIKKLEAEEKEKTDKLKKSFSSLLFTTEFFDFIENLSKSEQQRFIGDIHNHMNTFVKDISEEKANAATDTRVNDLFSHLPNIEETRGYNNVG